MDLEFKSIALEQTGISCERCGSRIGTAVVPCMTAYADSAQNVNPTLCTMCAEDYVANWTALWKEHNGR